MTVAVLFHRFGPYHVARLKAAARCGKVIGIELSANSREYAWDVIRATGDFQRLTISSDDTKVPKIEIANRLSRALEELSPSVVFVNGWAGVTAATALAWCQRYRIPAVVMSESTAIDEPRWFWKEAVKRQVVRCFAASLVGGFRQAEYVVSLGMPRDRVYLGYDAVDNDFFASGADAVRNNSCETRGRLGLPKQFFLASSRFIPKKNLPGLLRAYALYQQKTRQAAWHLVLLGDGPGRRELERVRADLQLTKWVQMPGFKQYHELPAYYGLAGAFVHASTSEQWGLVVNEAMAAGLPVLVSERCGCAPDLVRPGNTGFTFQPADPAALADLMIQIAADETLRARMGAEAQKAIQAYSPTAFADGLWKAAAAAEASPQPNPGVLGRLALAALCRC